MCVVMSFVMSTKFSLKEQWRLLICKQLHLYAYCTQLLQLSLISMERDITSVKLFIILIKLRLITLCQINKPIY